MEPQKIKTSSGSLFSFDFVVHNLQCSSNEILKSKRLTLCLRFLKFPIISLLLNRDNDSEQSYLQSKKGKSCLFRSSPEFLHRQLQELPLYIFLVDKIGTSPTVDILASCYLPLDKLAVISSKEINRHKGVHPTCHLQEGCVYLYNINGEKTAMLKITLRLCSFGNILSSHAFSKTAEFYQAGETEQTNLEIQRTEHQRSKCSINYQNDLEKNDKKNKLDATNDEVSLGSERVTSTKEDNVEMSEKEPKGDTIESQRTDVIPSHTEMDQNINSRQTSFESLSRNVTNGSQEQKDSDATNKSYVSNNLSLTDTFESLTNTKNGIDEMSKSQSESDDSINYNTNEFLSLTNDKNIDIKLSDGIPEHLDSHTSVLMSSENSESDILEDLSGASNKSITQSVSSANENNMNLVSDNALTDTFETMSKTVDKASSGSRFYFANNQSNKNQNSYEKESINNSNSLSNASIPNNTIVKMPADNNFVNGSKIRSKVMTIHYSNNISIQHFNDYKYSNIFHARDKMKNKNEVRLHLNIKECEYHEKIKDSLPKINVKSPFCQYCNTGWDDDYMFNTTQPTPLIWKAEA